MINKVTIQLAYVVLHLLVVDATDIKCPLNMTLFTLPDGSQDCEICRICPPGLIEVEPCGYRKDPVCICKDGFYRDALYNCWNCSSCPKGQYITMPCSWTEDVVCGNCTRCGERGEITPCSATSDTVCHDSVDAVLVVIAVGIPVIITVVVIVTIICKRRHICPCSAPKSITDGQGMEISTVKDHQETKSSTSKRLRSYSRKPTLDPHADPESMNLLELGNIVEEFYNSVGFVVHEDRTITVFRVGPKHVMTAYSAVKDLIASEKGYFEITFDVCSTAKNTYKINCPMFSDTDIDVAVFCISKTNQALPETVPLCIVSDRPKNAKLHFVSFENETILQRLHIRHNEVLVKGRQSYKDALKCIGSLQDATGKIYSPTKKNFRKTILEKSLNELNDGSMYVWSSSPNKIRSQGSPGFAKYGESFGVVCLFTHAWPLRDELKDEFNQSKMPVGKEWYAGPSMAAIYEKIKKADKDLAKTLFPTE